MIHLGYFSILIKTISPRKCTLLLVLIKKFERNVKEIIMIF